MLNSLNLSKHMITHMNKELTATAHNVEHINLDCNSISKLENLSHLKNLQQLSAGHNCLIKISGLEGIRNLTVLNLPENSICAIEGIGHLNMLTWLNLSGNNIRDIGGLDNNLALRHLDLSDNTITKLSNLSHLFALKALLLHGNIIREIKEAGKLLPKNLTILSLAENEITELTQTRSLSQLKKLEQLSMMNNPCITYQQLTHHNGSYRAYVLSWTCNLEVLDGQHVTVIDRQNARQLLSDGVSHTFSAGDQARLIQHLSHVTFNFAPQQDRSFSHSSRDRPVTAGGADRPPTAVTVRRTNSDSRVNRPDPAAARTDQAAADSFSLRPSQSPSKTKQTTLESSPSGSPLVSRRDMQGLIRQVIGQERGAVPVSGVTASPTLTTVPKQSAALPKMSRSRSASRSPAREKANRKLAFLSSTDRQEQLSMPAVEPDVAATEHARPSQTCADGSGDANVTFTQEHHRCAALIQSRWRGYATRNLNDVVQRMKQELRCRRLEEALAFVIGEMNRQQVINNEGQKVRASLLAGIEQLTHQFEALQSNQTDVSAV